MCLDNTYLKNAIASICKVAAPLSVGFLKNAFFGSALAKVGQDVWQGQNATCPSEKSSHFSKSPLSTFRCDIPMGRAAPAADQAPGGLLLPCVPAPDPPCPWVLLPPPAPTRSGTVPANPIPANPFYHNTNLEAFCFKQRIFFPPVQTDNNPIKETPSRILDNV